LSNSYLLQHGTKKLIEELHTDVKQFTELHVGGDNDVRENKTEKKDLINEVCFLFNRRKKNIYLINFQANTPKY